MYVQFFMRLTFPPGPKRSPIRHPDNRPLPVPVAGEVQQLLLEVRENRKLRLEAQRNKAIDGMEGAILKRLAENGNPLDCVTVSKQDLALLQESIKIEARKRNALAVNDNAIRRSGFRH